MAIHRFLLGLSALVGISLCGVTAASAQGVHLFAVLVSGNEVPGPINSDAHGTAAVTFSGAELRTVCVTIVMDGVQDITAAHIHEGFGQTAGPIRVPLSPPANANPGFSSSCHLIDAKLSKKIRANPYRFYLNVHTDAHPPGFIRGQLF